MEDNSNITFLEYYEKNYAIKIQDKRQPLLVVCDKSSDQPIYLIPEICKMTGLDKKSKNNNKLMNKIA